ncbi:hypothetical protein SVIOM342S_07186 [Streptomyces violaceorubidus]
MPSAIVGPLGGPPPGSVNTFHMQAFIVIPGYFSRSFDLSRKLRHAADHRSRGPLPRLRGRLAAGAPPRELEARRMPSAEYSS